MFMNHGEILLRMVDKEGDIISFDQVPGLAIGDGGFRVSGTRYEGSVLVLPERTLAWPVGEVSALTLDDFAAALAAEAAIEILLLGCGARSALVPPALRQAVRAAGPVLEPMDTGGACRTYNVLAVEERRVAAALIAVT